MDHDIRMRRGFRLVCSGLVPVYCDLIPVVADRETLDSGAVWNAQVVVVLKADSV
jgi:hypothetical protein